MVQANVLWLKVNLEHLTCGRDRWANSGYRNSGGAEMLRRRKMAEIAKQKKLI